VKIALFYYDGFSEFEIVLIALFFKDVDVVSVALEKREYRSEENQRYCVDQAIHEVDPGTIDLFVLPGGDPAPLVNNQELKRFLEELLYRGKKIGGICGGASLLAGLGLLKGKRCTGMGSGVVRDTPNHPYYAEATISTEQVVVDGNIITAQGQAYVEFAVELARQLDLCTKEEDYAEAQKWFKNIR